MDRELQSRVQDNLTDLPQKKSDSLVSLFCDADKLGYDYKREKIPYWNWAPGQTEKIDEIEVLAMHEDFRILWAKLKTDTLKRGDERTIINKINNEYPYNLTVFSNNNETQWDFINVKLVREELDEENKDPKKRKIVRRISVKEGDSIHTASERIAELAVRDILIQPLELQVIHDKAFDVEKITKEFFTKIARKFMELVGGTRKFGSRTEEFVKTLSLPGNPASETKHKEFAVRLIGRLLFCWFLKKKKSKNGTALLSQELLSSSAVTRNYYHQIIEPLFFEVLNKPINDRREPFKDEKWDITPFLNGGLFEPHSDDYYKYDMGASQFINTLKIPDAWFKGLFEIFESYNFTIDENTTIDIDLSIDPEMLGKIFENLLAEINPETGKSAQQKATGSYYTPRPIVEYMVDESLKQYLLQHTSLQEYTISALLSYTETVEISEAEQDKVINALDSLKILDPACGSGAFPMGVLQKMLLILQKIDPDSQKWMSVKLQRIEDPIIRNALQKKIENENWDYVRKLGIIRDSIFGVDIQPIAVEISRLRFFLSLVVDEDAEDGQENRGIIPLPNLEFKFVAANTLIGLLKETDNKDFGIQEKIIKELKKLRNEYFTSSGGNKKDIEQKFVNKQNELANIIIGWVYDKSQSLKLTNWNPFSNEESDWFDPEWMFGIQDGFNIVIANPPYVRHEMLGIDFKNLMKQKYPEVANGIADLYVYFFAIAFKLLKTEGTIIYITPNKYLKTKYGLELRNTLRKYQVDKIIDFFELPIFEAANDTAITIVRNEYETQSTKYFPVRSLSNLDLNILTRGNYLTSQKNDNEWIFIDNIQNQILEKFYQNSIPLKDFVNDKIYSGIKTAFNEAFVLSKDVAEELLKTESKTFVKKYAQSIDIKKWEILDKEKYFLATGYDVDIPKKYPSAYKFLKQFEEPLKKRLDKGKNWWNLRACKYYSEFERPKIIYMHTAKKHEFYLDIEGHYINNSCYMIVSDNKFLFCFLNSKLFEWFKRLKFVAYGDADEGGRCKLDYNKMITVPIKRISIDQLQQFITLVDRILSNTKDADYLRNYTKQAKVKELEDKIDIMVYKLYDLTYDEAKIVDPGIHLLREEYEQK